MSIPNVVVKGQATGNDFVLYADPDGAYEPTPQEIVNLCDRHFGVGADGLIRLTKPQFVADLSAQTVENLTNAGVEWFMDYRNADGSLAEMCGNGTRATALFAFTYGYAKSSDNESTNNPEFKLGTRAGVKTLTSLGEVRGLGSHVFRVDMESWSMGANGDLSTDEYAVRVADSTGMALGTFVDMGNPHVVAVIENAYSSLPVLEDLDLTQAPSVVPLQSEPVVSDNPELAQAQTAARVQALANGQNVEFVRIDEIHASEDLGEATMRVFERGCGETLSCGTGLCATAITLRAKTGVNHWLITVRGGTLRVDVTDSTVLLTGDAEMVYEAKLQ